MSPVPCSFQAPYIHFEFDLLRFIMFIFQPSLHFLFVLVFSFIPNDTGVTAEERCYSTELNSGKSFHYLILSMLGILRGFFGQVAGDRERRRRIS